MSMRDSYDDKSTNRTLTGKVRGLRTEPLRPGKPFQSPDPRQIVALNLAKPGRLSENAVAKNSSKKNATKSGNSKRMIETNAASKARRDTKGSSGFGRSGYKASSKATAGSKRTVDEKKSQKLRRDVKGASGFGRSNFGAKRRSSKSGSTGFGMTKTGVEDRAQSAWYNNHMRAFGEGMSDWDKYSGLTSWAAFGGDGPKKNGKKISYKQLEKESLQAGNSVRKKYGVKPLKSANDQHYKNNYGTRQRRRPNYPYDYDLSRGGKDGSSGRIGRN